jgi:hypothetical protein
MSDEQQRARLAKQREEEKDPAQREGYALAKRAGFDWYDTESCARRMALHAGGEVVALKDALKDADKLIDELEKHLDYCGWGDRWEREVSERLRNTLSERRAAITDVLKGVK